MTFDGIRHTDDNFIDQAVNRIHATHNQHAPSPNSAPDWLEGAEARESVVTGADMVSRFLPA